MKGLELSLALNSCSLISWQIATNSNFFVFFLSGTRVFLSVAVDLVVQEIRDPVRFLIETKARIFPQNEKFWYFGRKILLENFYVRLKDVSIQLIPTI